MQRSKFAQLAKEHAEKEAERLRVELEEVRARQEAERAAQDRDFRRVQDQAAQELLENKRLEEAARKQAEAVVTQVLHLFPVYLF